MAAVIINGDVSGSVTLQAPSVAGTTTLTLPTVSGTIAVSGDAPTFSGITDSGNLTFTGTGNRITGDFSNATFANRVSFQTNTANGATGISVIPNGTSTTASVQLFNSSDPDNATRVGLQLINTQFQLRGSKTGTGAYGDLVFLTSDTERMRIDSSGNVGVGTSSPGNKLDVAGNQGFTTAAYVFSYAGGTSGQVRSGFQLDGTNQQTLFFTGTNERMRIDSSGNVGIGTSSPIRKLTLSQSGAPEFVLQDTTQTTDQKNWRVFTGNDLYIGTLNDAGTSGTDCVRIDRSANFKFNSGYGSVATAYGCRAWVTFNGTGSTGTNQTIAASGNVTSVVKNGTGLYTINFTNAMPDANYAAVFGCNDNANTTTINYRQGGTKSTSAIQISTASGVATLADNNTVMVAIFR